MHVRKFVSWLGGMFILLYLCSNILLCSQVFQPIMPKGNTSLRKRNFCLVCCVYYCVFIVYLLQHCSFWINTNKNKEAKITKQLRNIPSNYICMYVCRKTTHIFPRNYTSAFSFFSFWILLVIILKIHYDVEASPHHCIGNNRLSYLKRNKCIS